MFLGIHVVSTGPDRKAFIAERDKALLDACVFSMQAQPSDHSTATIAPGMSATIDEPGIMDSGANISITNYDIVNKFHLTPQRWEESFHIKFGNGSRFHCTHYAYFGPILGKVAIVPDAPDTLLSIAVLTERGFEVRFLEHGRGVGIYKNQELMFHGPFDPTARLWHIDIASLICPPPSLDEREVNKVDLAFKEIPTLSPTEQQRTWTQFAT